MIYQNRQHIGCSGFGAGYPYRNAYEDSDGNASGNSYSSLLVMCGCEESRVLQSSQSFQQIIS
jgi:hypothetical protein